MINKKLNKNSEAVFSADFKNLEKIRDFVKQFALKNGFNEEVSDKIALAVDEACTNLIRYSFNFDNNQKIKISVQTDDRFFIVNIFDEGKPFNPLDVPKPDMNEYILNFKKGGLGIYLIRSVMDEIGYLPSNENNPQNTLTLKKLLA
ncbi:MAG: ATP-binding protein [Candidatus Kapabacteria bacterium]|nr:ATP-binding protein [Candidatus Kapabacteria bacterium]